MQKQIKYFEYEDMNGKKETAKEIVHENGDLEFIFFLEEEID